MAPKRTCRPGDAVDSFDLLWRLVDTLQVVEKMDLVLTVDTAMAHLCGALGVPCVVLLNAPCDWRWGQSGERTFLYDSCVWPDVLSPMPGTRPCCLPIDGLLSGCPKDRWFNMVRIKSPSMPGLTRYAGEDLGPAPHIVVLGSCKVGNFVVSTPVLSGPSVSVPRCCDRLRWQ